MLLIMSPLKAQNSQPLSSVFLLPNKAQVSSKFSEKPMIETLVETIIKYQLKSYFVRIFGFQEKEGF